MQVTEGKVIKFSHSIVSPIHGRWGTTEKTTIFPKALDKSIIEAIKGKTIGDTISLPYRLFENDIYDESLIISVNKNMFKTSQEIIPGMVFKATLNSRILQGVITEVKEEIVRVDCNNPMVGVKNAISNIRIIDIRNPTENELMTDFQPTVKVI